MTKRKKQQERFSGKIYDAEGRELPSNHLADWIEYKILAFNFSEYETESINYSYSLQDDVFSNAEQVFTSLKNFLIPRPTDHEAVERKLSLLFDSVLPFVKKAIEERDSFWSNKTAYYEAEAVLERIGQHVENYIIATPYCLPISEKTYFLTALKKSPDSFLAAQQDAEVKEYVSKLNEAKRNFPKELRDDGSDLPKQVKNYITGLQDVEEQFKNVNSIYAKNVQDIEIRRQNRGGFLNFLVDVKNFILGHESETSQLNRFQNKKQIFNALEKSYSRLITESRPLEFRATLSSLSHKVLTQPSKLTTENIIKLRVAMAQLLKSNDSVTQINIFADNVKNLLLNKLNSTLDNHNELENLFSLISENCLKEIPVFNNVRIQVIAFIKNKLTEFNDPQEAVQYIEQLKAAKPNGLDNTGEFSKQIALAGKQYSAWNNILTLGKQLIHGNIKPYLLDDLRACIIYASDSTLLLAKKAASDFLNDFHKAIINNIYDMHSYDERSVNDTIKVLSLQLIFLTTLDEKEQKYFEKSKVFVREAIISSLENLAPDQALCAIKNWEKLENKLSDFDETILTEIQDKKNRYKSLRLLQQGWDLILTDTNTSKLSTKEIDRFISAVLWIDKPYQSKFAIIETLKDFLPEKQDLFRDAAKQKIEELKTLVINDLDEIKKGPLTQEKRDALKMRLRFASKSNALYTKELGKLRKQVIETIQDHLRVRLTVEETKRYLDDLIAVLPEDLHADKELSGLIIKAKKQLVLSQFTDEQRKIHQAYEKELKFLKTGDAGLWNTIKSSINDRNRQDLTYQNILYWKHKFFDEYSDRLRRQRDGILSDAKYRPGIHANAEKVVVEYLDELIAKDYKSIADTLIEELLELTDLRRQYLSRIFKLPIKQVNINRFVLGCFAGAENQRFNRNNPVLREAGQDFVRQFHEQAQDSGGFVTELIAKLPFDALEEMFLTWSRDPDVNISKHAYLKNDIIGRVDASQDTHIQVPRYLLVSMALQLIVKDFDSLLKGENVDFNLLTDRIEFVIPKLEQEVKLEHSLNENSQPIRNVLLSALDKMNPLAVRDKYKAIINSQMPEGYVTTDSYGLFDNFPACEERVLNKLKAAVKDQVDLVNNIQPSEFDYGIEQGMVRTLDQQINDMQMELLVSRKDYDRKLIENEITNLIKQKKEHEQAIDVKKAREHLIKEYRVYAVSVDKLLTNDKLTLKEFINGLNIKLFELLDPELAELCSQIKHNLASFALLNDKEFGKIKNKLQKDLNDHSSDIIPIIRQIPVVLTNELNNRSADMVKQLQYRFADRFRNLMVNLLSIKNLSETNQSSSIKKEAATKPSQSLLTFFSKPQANDVPMPGKSNTVEDKLKKVFNSLRPATLERMLDQLALAADADKESMNNLYNIAGLKIKNKTADLKPKTEDLKPKTEPIDIQNNKSIRNHC